MLLASARTPREFSFHTLWFRARTWTVAVCASGGLARQWRWWSEPEDVSAVIPHAFRVADASPVRVVGLADVVRLCALTLILVQFVLWANSFLDKSLDSIRFDSCVCVCVCVCVCDCLVHCLLDFECR